jgi:hypothetical protein
MVQLLDDQVAGLDGRTGRKKAESIVCKRFKLHDGNVRNLLVALVHCFHDTPIFWVCFSQSLKTMQMSCSALSKETTIETYQKMIIDIKK